MDNSYFKLAYHYYNCFKEHGDTPQGLNWPNEVDLKTRYEVMLGVTQGEDNVSILDFGCGTGGFYQALVDSVHAPFIKYTGIDINKEIIEKAREKFPEASFGWIDINSVQGEEAFNNPTVFQEKFDYIICNGTFTVKGDMSQREMTNFMYSSLEKLWTKCSKGIAFNVMSKLVDWERDDLFHVSMDQLSQWLCDNLSRNIIIRQDYKLYEYTVYVYK